MALCCLCFTYLEELSSSRDPGLLVLWESWMGQALEAAQELLTKLL